ncbi:MAG TPA: dihydroorotase [Candidatus Polarisedimenticolaceae bacterium]|nr:dihydroorotase [Candidatus Polarisedimenticolaceae bacterium]
MTLLLRNARLVDPEAGWDGPGDVLIDGGRVTRVAKTIAPDGAKEIDLGGLVVCPGFIDMHVHLREPGQEWKETIATGTRAAAAGGFTGVACMPNTEPPIDSRSVVEFVLAQARLHGVVPVYPIGCVSKAQKGEELAEMGDMALAGARGFSDDGKPVASAGLMRRALEYAQIFDLPVIDHCEEPTLVKGGVVHEGEISTRLGLAGWPGVAEDIMVSRDILLAEATGGAVHIAHMSTGRAAGLVRSAKASGIRVTCEVTPHHIALTDEAVLGYDADAKMNPPLRRPTDREALLAAIADGTVDAIATDHAPHHADEKCVEFSRAPFGVVGLETAVSICLDRLVHGGIVPLARLVELLSAGPARVLRLAKGSLKPGSDADVTVLDLDREVKVDAGRFASKSSNTPFRGWTLRGAAVMTIVGGHVVHDAR